MDKSRSGVKKDASTDAADVEWKPVEGLTLNKGILYDAGGGWQWKRGGWFLFIAGFAWFLITTFWTVMPPIEILLMVIGLFIVLVVPREAELIGQFDFGDLEQSVENTKRDIGDAFAPVLKDAVDGLNETEEKDGYQL